jgi:hypothetical protein
MHYLKNNKSGLMNMKLTGIIILLGLFISLNAQNSNDFSRIDKIMMQIPDSVTHSTTGIARYIDSNFSNQSDKSRAVFIWVAKNIQYDYENMFAINFYANTNEIVDKVLKTRKGICMHYAELFNDIATKLGIRTYVISGYIKQNGFVDYIPHAWCAGLIDSTWFMFDPTWGSGYIQNAKFVRQVNNFYFKTKPDQLIKSHMPFDPLWQFLNYPLTNQDFYDGKFSINTTKPFFNYSDTLTNYELESEIGRLISSSNRIEKNGVKNSLIYDILQHNKVEIKYYQDKLLVETLNAAIYSYNEGINQLNRFIDYRNKQFTPSKPDNEIRKMVDDADIPLTSAREKLKEMKDPDSNNAATMVQLSKSIDEAYINLNEQKAFLDKYFKTGKMFRKTLFNKYTWMGLPLN